MIVLHPYLNFPGNTKEVMEFYKDAIAGTELELQKISDSPMKDQAPKETWDSVMHSRLSLNGETLVMAADAVMNETPVNGNSAWLCLSGGLAEIKSAFEKLSAGGNVIMPLKTEFFGTFGTFTDKYGICWMVQSEETE